MTDDERKQTRDASLEEAAQVAICAVQAWMGGHGPSVDCDGYVAERIRALKSSTATVLPVELVREVLRNAHRSTMAKHTRAMLVAVAHNLGLDLDEKEE